MDTEQLELEPPEIETRYRFSFKGKMEMIYEQTKVRVDRLRLSIFFLGDTPEPDSIIADLRFVPKSGRKLIRYFPLLEGIDNEIYSYSFEFKPMILDAYKEAMADLDAQDMSWVTFEEGLLLKLENYRCIGHGTWDVSPQQRKAKKKGAQNPNQKKQQKSNAKEKKPTQSKDKSE